MYWIIKYCRSSEIDSLYWPFPRDSRDDLELVRRGAPNLEERPLLQTLLGRSTSFATSSTRTLVQPGSTIGMTRRTIPKSRGHSTLMAQSTSGPLPSAHDRGSIEELEIAKRLTKRVIHDEPKVARTIHGFPRSVTPPPGRSPIFVPEGKRHDDDRDKMAGVMDMGPTEYMKDEQAHMTRAFQDKPVSVGLTGLRGCTLLILVSRHGVSLTHIFETTMGNGGRFENLIIRPFNRETASGGQKPGPANAVIMMADEYRFRLSLPAIAQYWDHIHELQNAVKKRFPDAKIQKQRYHPQRISTIGQPSHKVSTGRALVQYEPKCHGLGKSPKSCYKAWWEGTLLAQDTWQTSSTSLKSRLTGLLGRRP